jgi:Ser/Thr protein kinase RdoA (MazF antagonist)
VLDTLAEVELLAEGRNAEVFAYGEGRVLKLDRPDWTGLSPFEAEMLDLLAGAGLPVARSHGAVTVDGRSGVVLDRIDGVPLVELIVAVDQGRVEDLAARFVELQWAINSSEIAGLPPLLPRLRLELETTVGDVRLRTELLARLDALDDGTLGVVHYDFHPNNVLVTSDDRWIVIDWLTVAAGPPAADLARTLVLWGQQTSGAVATFMATVRRLGVQRRALDDDALDDWIRIVAAGRLGEGFEGVEAEWLHRVAAGSLRLFV